MISRWVPGRALANCGVKNNLVRFFYKRLLRSGLCDKQSCILVFTVNIETDITNKGVFFPRINVVFTEEDKNPELQNDMAINKTVW